MATVATSSPSRMAAAPMATFDNFKQEDYDAMFEKHAWTDRSEVDIDQYLTPEERRDMCDYEKDRLRNIKKNYDVMIDMGLTAEKPYFMQKNRQKFYQPVDDSSESDRDCGPSRDRHRRSVKKAVRGSKGDRAPTTDSRRVEEAVSDTSSDSDGEWVPAQVRPRNSRSGRACWKPPLRKASAAPSVKPAKVAAKGKRTNTKSNKSGASRGRTAAPVDEEVPVVPSDSEGEEDFVGFSAVDIERSEAYSAEVGPRNEEILAAIEAGTYDFDISDDDDEGSESGDSEVAAAPLEVVTEAAVTTADRPGRYPRRTVTRKVYTEPEVPKDDDYLYCEDCDQDYEGDCPVHGPLIIIHDTKVANDGSDPDRADHSLPQGLVVRKSQIPLAGDGVWAEQAVVKNARFGPYEGTKMYNMDEAHKSGYCWLIYEDGEKVSHYVDARDKSHANWLRYVNCARHEGEQNVLAYQFHGEVYYRTVQEILPGQELLVWYGDEYGRELGLLPHGGEHGDRPQTIQLGQAALQKLFHDAGFSVWTCEVCERVFPSETWRDGHRRHHGDRTGSKRYTCTQCTYSTDYSQKYNRHLVTHSGERPHTCKVCGKGFTQSQNLSRHERTHTGVRPYTCPVCNKGFTEAGNLQTHSRTHTGEKPYSCPLCAQGFNRSSNLTVHMMTHTGEKPYSCTLCEYRCNGSNTLTRHMRSHTGQHPYVCTTCGCGFSQSRNLNVHMRTHTGERPHTCTTCGQRFSDAGSLTRHKMPHTGEKPHVCTTCGQSFSEAGTLSRHMRAHTAEQSHTCKDCGQGFSDPQSLSVHMTTRTGEKPYNCKTHTGEQLSSSLSTMCGRGFRNSGSLTTHMKTHTAEQSHVCQDCGKTFSRADSLTRHMKNHTGEKPHKCTTCGLEFSHLQSLTKHMRTHTGEKPQGAQGVSQSQTLTTHIKTNTEEHRYGCITCGVRFTRSQQLTAHMSSHTGEKPHVCATCGLGFTRSTTLKDHSYTHTGQWPHTCSVCSRGFSRPGELKKHTDSYHSEIKPLSCD